VAAASKAMVQAAGGGRSAGKKQHPSSREFVQEEAEEAKQGVAGRHTLLLQLELPGDMAGDKLGIEEFHHQLASRRPLVVSVPSEAFTLTVVLPTGRALSLLCWQQDTPSKLKEAFRQESELSEEDMTEHAFFFNGSWMGNDLPVCHFGVPWEGTRLDLKHRLTPCVWQRNSPKAVRHVAQKACRAQPA